jgi:AbrB family looped-hinge helix DNA binding protein
MTIETAVVTSKGQLVIPVRFRRSLGIKKGTTVAFLEDKGKLVIQPLTAQFLSEMRGSLNQRKEK